MADQPTRRGAHDAARDDAGREEDAQKRPYDEPGPGAVLGGLLVLVDVDLIPLVLVYHGGVVGTDNPGGVKLLDHVVIGLRTFPVGVGPHEHEHTVFCAHPLDLLVASDNRSSGR